MRSAPRQAELSPKPRRLSLFGFELAQPIQRRMARLGRADSSTRYSKAEQGLDLPPSSLSLATKTRRLLGILAVACTVAVLTACFTLRPPTGRLPAYLDPARMAQIQGQCLSWGAHSSADTDITIAHLISAHHDESIISMGLLLQELYDPADLYVIHIKQTTTSAHLAPLAAAFGACGNVVFVPDDERVESGYADFSIVEMELAMLRTALEQPQRWTYALLMDGSSWPTMPTSERRDWFRRQPADSSQTFARNRTDSSLLSVCPGPKCSRTLARCADAACSSWTRTPHGLPVAMGWQWVRLSYELADWIIHSPEMPAWTAFFKPTHTPDEHFFSTVHWASPFRDKSSAKEFMYVDWQNTRYCQWWPNPRPRQSPCYLSAIEAGDVWRSRMPFMRKVASGDHELRAILPRSTKRPDTLPLWKPLEG